jgi:hypothetical protein
MLKRLFPNLARLSAADWVFQVPLALFMLWGLCLLTVAPFVYVNLSTL